MKKLILLTVLASAMLVVPAQAAGPQQASKCVPHNRDYRASGHLVSSALTSDGNGRYSGTLEVDVTRANHHAATGDQTFTLDHAKVKFHHGVDPSAPAPGSRVKLQGRITHLPKHCQPGDFTPTTTVKKVDIRQAKH